MISHRRIHLIIFCRKLAVNALDVSVNSLYYEDSTSVDQNKKYSGLVFPFLVAGGLLIADSAFSSYCFHKAEY